MRTGVIPIAVSIGELNNCGAQGVKYAHEHPREKDAALLCDGSAEDAASYRKGQRAAEEAAYKAALADPIEACAAARWAESAAKLREAKERPTDR
jgi:hypothetical protein